MATPESIASNFLTYAAVTPDRLLETVDPQPTGIQRFPTVLEAIAKCFGHLEHHTGQIILLTELLTATDLNLSLPANSNVYIP